jgi:hypothetical protein
MDELETWSTEIALLLSQAARLETLRRRSSL